MFQSVSRRCLLPVFALCVLLSGALSALAQEEVDLELVLLADATGSIDDAEIRFQREGYAKGMTDPAVLRAIENTLTGRIAVTYVEWAGASSQHVVVDWMIIDGAQSAQAFASAIMPPPRLAWGRNAIGAALLFGTNSILNNQYEGLRKVIDFSADGPINFDGPPTEVGRAAALSQGITINGLSVLCRTCSGRPFSGGFSPEEIFRQQIIGGPGAFLVTAESAQTFADAVRRKLVLEIAGLMPGDVRVAAFPGSD